MSFCWSMKPPAPAHSCGTAGRKGSLLSPSPSTPPRPRSALRSRGRARGVAGALRPTDLVVVGARPRAAAVASRTSRRPSRRWSRARRRRAGCCARPAPEGATLRPAGYRRSAWPAGARRAPPRRHRHQASPEKLRARYRPRSIAATISRRRGASADRIASASRQARSCGSRCPARRERPAAPRGSARPARAAPAGGTIRSRAPVMIVVGAATSFSLRSSAGRSRPASAARP